MACEDCGVDPNKVVGIAMVPMKPGPDGKPWEFCLKCFRDGATPHKLGRIKTVVIHDEKLYDALVVQSERLANVGTPVDTEGKPRKRKAS